MTPINPGIAPTVQALREAGFNTTDSGDGQTHAHSCDREHAYVTIICEPDRLIAESIRARSFLEQRGVHVDQIGGSPNSVSIQATFDPVNGFALIDIAANDANPTGFTTT